MRVPPSAVIARVGQIPPSIPNFDRPWLPMPWPLQAERFGVFATDAATETEWARVILQLGLSHPPTPLASPRVAADIHPETLALCWGLNRVIQATALDAALTDVGYDAALSRHEAVLWFETAGLQSPEYLRVLGALELLARQATTEELTRFKAACGEDVMRAGYQLNMVCIDPDDGDRTLLQVQRIALRLCGEMGDTLRSEFQLILSDGQTVAAL